MASAPPGSGPEITQAKGPEDIDTITAMLTEIRIGTGFPQLQSDSGREYVGKTAEWASAPYMRRVSAQKVAAYG